MFLSLSIVSFTLLTTAANHVYATAGQWSANGSIIYYTDGNVGLGTTNPQSPLHIKGNNITFNMESNETLSLTSTDGSGLIRIDNDNDSTGNYFAIQDYTGQFLMRVQDDGKIGVGTDNPQGKLHLAGNVHGGQLKLQNLPTSPVMGIRAWHDGSKNLLMFYTQVGAPADKFPLVITEHQNIGIKTMNPTADLSVNGTVLAKQVIVSTAASYWPDYVFSSDYKLKPLSEVEEYIKVNGHLPGIESAAEVEKSGLSLSDMQIKQMEKIEELTLHMIQQEKEIEELKAKVELIADK
jgi:hypothetical protein